MAALQIGIDLFNVIVEVCVGCWLFDLPKYRRFQRRWVQVLGLGLTCVLPGLNIMGNRLLGCRFSNSLIITVIFLDFLLLIFFTKRSAVCCLAWAGIYYGTAALLELPKLALGGWALKIPYVYCIYQVTVYDYIYLLVLSLSFLFILKKWGKCLKAQMENMITSKNAWLWVVFCVAEWWVVFYFLAIGYTKYGPDVFIFTLVTLALILILLVLFAGVIVNREKEKVQMKNVMEEKNREAVYEKIKFSYEEKSRQIHDMRHQLYPIESYLVSDQNDEALAYVKALLGALNKSQEYIPVWTGNAAADSLLSIKAEMARKQDIEIHMYISLLQVFLSDKDLCVLFGNLLDNAIEAAALCSHKKWVDIRIIQKGNMLLFSIRNTFRYSPVQKDGRFISTKEKPESHGWGLASVRAIVESYGGDLEIHYDDKIFEVSAIFLRR